MWFYDYWENGELLPEQLEEEVTRTDVNHKRTYSHGGIAANQIR